MISWWFKLWLAFWGHNISTTFSVLCRQTSACLSFILPSLQTICSTCQTCSLKSSQYKGDLLTSHSDKQFTEQWLEAQLISQTLRNCYSNAVCFGSNSSDFSMVNGNALTRKSYVCYGYHVRTKLSHVASMTWSCKNIFSNIKTIQSYRPKSVPLCTRQNH